MKAYNLNEQKQIIILGYGRAITIWYKFYRIMITAFGLPNAFYCGGGKYKYQYTFYPEFWLH